MVAVKNKAQVWVFAGIKRIEGRLPFSILGLDSDNGAEFILKVKQNSRVKAGLFSIVEKRKN